MVESVRVAVAKLVIVSVTGSVVKLLKDRVMVSYAGSVTKVVDTVVMVDVWVSVTVTGTRLV